MKVLTVFGTRPEAIKLAPVIHELRRRARKRDLHPVVCVTGQHRLLLDQALSTFGIEADHDLDVMENGQSPSRVAAHVLARLEPVLAAERPDWVLVQGDTTTAAAAALATFYGGSRVGHVEAGLRTHDKRRPFPEELNRRLAAVIADLHFAPTAAACRNLLDEGVPEERIMLTGNTVIDALRQVTSRSPAERNGSSPVVGDASLIGRRKLVLVTAHRRESFGEPFREICLALRDLAQLYADDVHLLYSVHPNPQVWRPAHKLLGGLTNVTLMPPVDYWVLLELIQRSHLVLTDSGGIQEEAPAFGVPVLVLRQVTERPEGVVAGTARVVGIRRGAIVRATSTLLDDPEDHAAMAHAVNPYGDGRASRRIVAALLGEPFEPFAPGESAQPLAGSELREAE